MAKRKPAPPGTFWREGVLWGRIQIKNRDRKWSLKTDQPDIAAARYKIDKERLVADAHYGDARRTFEEVADAWHQQLPRQVGVKTAMRYGVSLGQLAPYLEDKFLDEITGVLIADIIRRRSVRASNATIKRDLVALSSIMNYAIDQGWIEANPVLARMRRLKERRDPIVLPELASVRMVIERAPGMFAKLIEAAWKTGARQDELVRAKRQHLDLDRKRLTVYHGKGRKLRVIDIEPFGGVELFQLPAAIGDAPLFWHGAGKPYTNVSSRFAGFVRELAKEHSGTFQPFRFHHLRHLHAVEWLRSGRSLYDLQQRLGHSSIKVTEVYLAYLTPEEKRAVM